MSIKVIIPAQYDFNKLSNEEKEVIEGVQKGFDTFDFSFVDDSLNFVPVGFFYNHFERKSLAKFVIVNKYKDTVKSVHCRINMAVKNKPEIIIAETTLDFDNVFLGSIKYDDGLLFSVNIPTWGLTENKNFMLSELDISVSEIFVEFDKEK